jgi:hypothetical protein
MSTAALALALALAAGPAAKEGKDALEARRKELAGQVMQVAARVQREIEAGDLKALLARVPAEGLRCGGRVVPRARVEHDLRTEGTWLHAVLFGGAGASAPPGQPASLRDFFAGAKEVAVTVGFREDPRSPVGLPCAEFRARDTVTPGAPFCFEQKEGRWWFAESLYPC